MSKFTREQIAFALRQAEVGTAFVGVPFGASRPFRGIWSANNTPSAGQH
ncbi:hypothetical protein [Sphingobium nicotianae]|uniref:Uncharacterized protein n=1 Tax=Sphingobium nicotianae TaxID=2782607 RepID=A0A9X1DAD5_9SPHN|nr:hypothetical protein [Sphingobium nicotianae]MBT2186340.1 hypothetical protein [Sphingobium nicotianae]